MPWWLIIFIVFFVLWAISAAFDEQQKKDQAASDAMVAARRPETFKRLFGEEFPAFAHDLTTVRCEAFLRAWSEVLADARYKQRLNRSGQFKSDQAMVEGATLVVAATASWISPAFVEVAKQEPLETYKKLAAVVMLTDRLSAVPAAT